MNRSRLFLGIIGLTMGTVFLVTCCASQSPATLAPTWTPLQTSTTHVSTVAAVPTSAVPPLTQTWQVGPVILEFKTLFENTAPFGTSQTPGLILYSDGRLIVRSDAGLQESQLSRQEICTLLNTIDQAGFFDFDMSPYQEQLNELPLGVVSITVIEVNAWEQRGIVATALWEIMDDPAIQVPSSLRSVYLLLSHYRPAGLQPYQYNQLAFTIYKYPPDHSHRTETEWPLKSPSLKELFKEAEKTNVKNREQGFGLLLEGETAATVYQAINPNALQSFVEDDETYVVSARPLLPYESLESAVSYEARIPSSGVATHTVELTCYSTDGTLEIP